MNQLATNSICNPRDMPGVAMTMTRTRTVNTLTTTAFASLFAAACARRAAAITRAGGQ